MLIYWCVSLFHLLIRNANCDIWYHIFYRSTKILGGGGGAHLMFTSSVLSNYLPNPIPIWVFYVSLATEIIKITHVYRMSWRCSGVLENEHMWCLPGTLLSGFSFLRSCNINISSSLELFLMCLFDPLCISNASFIADIIL